MTPELLFQWVNPVALAGWLALAFLPLAPRLLGIAAGTVVPLLLSTAYAALVLAFWSSSKGGFDSLDAVARLFENRWLLLAGWVHYLAFDLLIGAWEVRTARREGMAHAWLLPCLAVTFLFGPAGYLLFQALRVSLKSRPAAAGA
ncbi:MAG: ABA4-like family protein [Betaproteobacteria bacterium]